MELSEQKKKIAEYIETLFDNGNSDYIGELNDFSICLKVFRTEKGITQKELAQYINVSENSIYNYEKGKSRPTKNNKKKLMDYLGINEIILDFTDTILIHYKLEIKETYKKSNKTEEKKIENILNSIKEINSGVLNEIVKFILEKQYLSIDDFYKVIKGFQMLRAYNDFIIGSSSGYNHSESKENAICDYIHMLNIQTEESVIFKIEDFINEVLLYLPNEINKIFERKQDITERYINKNNQKTKEEQYNKIKEFVFKDDKIIPIGNKGDE